MDSQLAAFLARLKDDGAAALTIDSYHQNLRRFLAWCRIQRVDPLAATIEQIRAYLRCFPSLRTRRLHLAGLRGFYDFLVAGGMVAANPTRAKDARGKPLLPYPRLRRRLPRVLTDEEVQALFAAAAGDLEAELLLRLMRFSGLRVGEVVGYRRTVWDPHAGRRVTFTVPGVRVGDLDLDRLLIRVRSKGGDQDDASMVALLDEQTAWLISQLLQTLPHRHPDAPIFQTPDGRPKGTRWAWRVFSRLLRQISPGRHLTPHMLRHTLGTRTLEAGGDLRAVQRILRHRDLDSTLIYADYIHDDALRSQYDRFSGAKQVKGLDSRGAGGAGGAVDGRSGRSVRRTTALGRADPEPEGTAG